MPTLSKIEEMHLQVLGHLENMFADVRRYAQQYELVRELDAAILHSTFSPQQVLELIVKKCLAHAEAEHGQVVLYRGGRLFVAASSEPDRVGQELPIKGSLSGAAVLEREEQHCPDLSTLPAESYVRYHETTRSELVLPIQPVNEGRVLGVIDLERNVTGPFSERALAFAHLLAGQAAIAIEHARIASGVQTLYEISNSVASGALSLQESCSAILLALLAKSDFRHGQILIRERDKLVIVASSRSEDIGLMPGPESSVCGRYLLGEEGNEILLINDIARSPYQDFYLGLLGADGPPMRSELIVPLLNLAGETIGALNIESPELSVFSSFDKNFFGTVGNFLAGAVWAALARQKRIRDEQIKTADLAMTQLGSIAHSFLHRFGSAIGDTRLRLISLGQHLSGRSLPPVPEETTGIEEFVAGMVDSLTDAADTLIEFNNRFNPGSEEFKFHDVDLAATAEELVRRYQIKYASSQIDFVFDNLLRVVKREGRSPVYSKAICRLTDKVGEVVENLLDNAIRAIEERPPGADRGKIIVSVRLNDALRARLRVTDNGVGIPQRDQPRIFEFGFTSRKKRGVSHGIGLSFCQHYAFQVGGELRFQSVEGNGSWFEIEFPTIDA